MFGYISKKRRKELEEERIRQIKELENIQQELKKEKEYYELTGMKITDVKGRSNE